MVGVGLLHFLRPEAFVRIVPDYLPAPGALVMVSGVFEILGGVGILLAKVRRLASYGLVALYLAVFPANVNMVVHPEPAAGRAHRVGTVGGRSTEARRVESTLS
jgi:uncharacterized membrane protein